MSCQSSIGISLPIVVSHHNHESMLWADIRRTYMDFYACKWVSTSRMEGRWVLNSILICQTIMIYELASFIWDWWLARWKNVWHSVDWMHRVWRSGIRGHGSFKNTSFLLCDKSFRRWYIAFTPQLSLGITNPSYLPWVFHILCRQPADVPRKLRTRFAAQAEFKLQSLTWLVFSTKGSFRPNNETPNSSSVQPVNNSNPPDRPYGKVRS